MKILCSAYKKYSPELKLVKKIIFPIFISGVTTLNARLNTQKKNRHYRVAILDFFGSVN